MRVTLIIMGLLAFSLTAMVYVRDPQLPLEGLKDGWKLFWGIFPALVLAFIAAGMIGKILPRAMTTRFLGEESGGLHRVAVIFRLTLIVKFIRYFKTGISTEMCAPSEAPFSC